MAATAHRPLAGAAPEDGVAWVAELAAGWRFRRLRAYGVTEADIPALVEKAARASSMKGNPIVLTDEELRAIASRAL